MQRDDFENQLGQGLKRWAESGKPTLDLEAYVHDQTGETPVQTPARRRRPAWVRWTGTTAAAAVILFGLTLTFPSWAGAAAGWPVIGPVVTEIIMKDAGLKWAYDEGIIQGSVAEVTVGGKKVRILGFVASQTRTAVIYQIPDWPKPEEDAHGGKPIPATDRLLGNWHRPVWYDYPRIAISSVAGQGAGSWHQQPVWTPLGLVGIVETQALEAESAPVQLTLSFGDEKRTLDFTIVRTDKDSRTVAAEPGSSQSIGGMTVKLESVNYTPAETRVSYEIEGRTFSGGYSWSNHDGTAALESGGERTYPTQSTGVGGRRFNVFPAVQPPARIIIPALVKGVDADLVWRLEQGATQTFSGITITLSDWQRGGDQIAFEWSYDRNADVIAGFHQFEVIDAEGKVYPLEFRSSSTSSGAGPEVRTFDSTLPADVKPVAVRAKEVGVIVKGPWILDLPR